MEEMITLWKDKQSHTMTQSEFDRVHKIAPDFYTMIQTTESMSFEDLREWMNNSNTTTNQHFKDVHNFLAIEAQKIQEVNEQYRETTREIENGFLQQTK